MKTYIFLFALVTMISARLGLAEELSIESAIDRAIIPEVEFRQSDPIDAIVFLVNTIMNPATNTPSIGIGSTNNVTRRQWESNFVIVNVTEEKRRPMTLSVRDHSMKQLIELICKTRDLQYKIENNRIVISNAK